MDPTRVLLVDDDVTLLQVLPETVRLRMTGVEVDTAENAADALARVAATDYDAVITDIKMPGMDGLTLLSRIRELRPDVPTLLITGHGEHDLAVQALRGGAYDFIQKPIDREYFVASLGRAVHVRHLRREIDRQRRALEQHAGLLEVTLQDQTHALRLLVDASRIFADSFDSEATLTSLVRLALPRLGEWSAGFLLGEEGQLRRVEVAHTDPAREVQLRDHLRDLPARLGARDAEAFQRSRPLLVADVTDEWLETGGMAAPFVDLVRVMEARSTMIVPLLARGRVWGAIGFASSARRYSVEDLDFADALCRRAALAIDNARLYERERSIAETLQRSLLPESLPEIPGVEASARYQPANPEAVGGDWYDLFRLPGGRIGLVMGDVAGRGVRVAAVMGQLRNALRAYALEGYPPEVVVRRLGVLVEPSDMATVLYMVLDPSNWTVEFANAGHLPPLVVQPDGSGRFLEGGNPPLGGFRHHAYRRVQAQIQPGSTLLLYTDGLVESRGVAIDAGLERLRHAAAEDGRTGLEGLLDRLLRGVAGGGSGDDIAVLAVRATPLDEGRVVVRLPAEPASVPAVRHALRRWLEQRGVPSREIYEVTVACCEACSNTVEHAYGLAEGTLKVTGSIEDEEIVLRVEDTGRWRAPRGENRGRGLRLIEALMDSVEVEPSAGGTVVVMRRRFRERVEA